MHFHHLMRDPRALPTPSPRFAKRSEFCYKIQVNDDLRPAESEPMQAPFTDNIQAPPALGLALRILAVVTILHDSIDDDFEAVAQLDEVAPGGSA